jgi:cytochrome d ubiquinol oxidase subunit II
MNFDAFLPTLFLGIMGLCMLIYVVLDGYDLGTGMLLPFATAEQKNTMMESIGPFWDANETWLVLGVGILLIAFPHAHGVVLTALYLPATLMLLGLILRGASFDFRMKAQSSHQALWDKLFTLGSWITAMAQGWMLGAYILGLGPSGDSYVAIWGFYAFCTLIALTLPALYTLLGAGWLIMKTDGPLQSRALSWARKAWWPMVIGLTAVSLATPWVSTEIYHKWFGSLQSFMSLVPIPLFTGLTLLVVYHISTKPLLVEQGYGWVIYVGMVLVCIFATLGLAYSLYPYIVIGQITAQQAASSPSSLWIILFGAAITLPMIFIYNVWVYRIFWGKVTQRTQNPT